VNTIEGTTVLTAGLSSYRGMKGRKHLPKTVGLMAAHVLLPWIHRVFSHLKRLGLGVYRGFRRAHIQAYLDEFVFRWNRRHYRSSFDMLLGIGIRTASIGANRQDIAEQELTVIQVSNKAHASNRAEFFHLACEKTMLWTRIEAFPA
jgi:hypothetical protein